MTLSARAIAWRQSLPLRQGDPDCTHPGGYYRETAPGWVRRDCRRCGAPQGPIELRCKGVTRDGRRCWAPGRHDGHCRVHARAEA